MDHKHKGSLKGNTVFCSYMLSFQWLQAEKAAGASDQRSGTWFSNPGLENGKTDSGAQVGKYLDAAPKPAPKLPVIAEAEARPPAKKQKAVYGNFDAW